MLRHISAKDYRKLPETPGVYLMKDAAGRVLYIGKAGNLKRRVSSYFQRPQDGRIQRMVQDIVRIGYEMTDTAIEALIREAELIKTIQPPYNIREKDDTSFPFIEITKEEFPRVLLIRGKDTLGGKRFGPFTASSQAREALQIVRRIFPFHTHTPDEMKKAGIDRRPCFNYGIGLCPGTCAGFISKMDYRKIVHNIERFLSGKKKMVVQALEKEMKASSKALAFEKAQVARRQLFALQHIQDVALIHDNEHLIAEEAVGKRIEGYDVSNISGDAAVGSMVVFVDGKPAKDEYRKFKIRNEGRSGEGGDTAMMKEMLTRRFGNNWPRPDLILVDGGKPQVGVAESVVRSFGFRIPVIGLAKGPERKRNDVHGAIPAWTDLATLIRVRDEAHRFAVTYHKTVRARKFIPR